MNKDNFNNFLNLPNSKIVSSRKSSFYCKDDQSDFKRIKSDKSNEINLDESENSIDKKFKKNIIDKKSSEDHIINNENNEGDRNQNIKIYNVKKNNNYYLLLK